MGFGPIVGCSATALKSLRCLAIQSVNGKIIWSVRDFANGVRVLLNGVAEIAEPFFTVLILNENGYATSQIE